MEEQSVAIVTGGSRGIGRAVVEGLADRGWTVWFCSRREESVAAAQEKLRERWGNRIRGAAIDVRDPGRVASFVESVLAAEGRIDLLVNNAGLGRFAPVDELSPEEWDESIATNLSGAFYALRAVAPGMRDAGSGWIVNVASLAARHPFAGGAAYNASKFGLLGMSEAAMLDLRPHGVRVTTILPGSVDTDFGAGKGGDWKLRPEDVARAILDLLDYPPRALPSRVELRPTRTGSG